MDYKTDQINIPNTCIFRLFTTDSILLAASIIPLLLPQLFQTKRDYRITTIKTVKISMSTHTFPLVHNSIYSTGSFVIPLILSSVTSNKKGLQNYGRLKQLDKHTDTYISTCSQQYLFYWQFRYSTQLFQTKRDYRIMAD